VREADADRGEPPELRTTSLGWVAGTTEMKSVAAPPRTSPPHDELALRSSKPAVRHVRCPPGEGIADPRPGDVILIRGRGPLGTLIRLVQRVRLRRPEDRGFAYWSHAALIISPPGYVIEVIHAGVIARKLESYRWHDYHCVQLDLSEAQRHEVVRFAWSCLRQKYGTLSSILLGLSVLLGDRLWVPERGQQGCGALIARALERVGLKFERTPANTLPADLAKRFGARP